MLNQPTLEKLHKLRLSAMADAWTEQEQRSDSHKLDFDERFAMLVDAEYLTRENRKLTRLMKQAKLRISDACIEDIAASPSRGLDKSLIRQLGSLEWLSHRMNVLLTGATGVGKSHLACALGQLACRRGHRVLYRRVPRLFEEISLAKADGSYTRLLQKIGKHQLLILDDLGMGKLREAQRHDLLEVLEDRYDTQATVVTSQLPFAKWHDWIGDPTIADAILDRLVHNAYKVELKGPSRRKTKAKNKK